MTMTQPQQAWRRLHAAKPGSRRINARDLLNVPQIGRPVASADGGALAVPIVHADFQTDGYRRLIQLACPHEKTPTWIRAPWTAPDEDSFSPVFSPAGQRVAFTASVGSTPPQLFVASLDSDSARRLSDLPLGVFDPKWLPDGSGLLFAAMLRDGHETPEATRSQVARDLERATRVRITEERLYRFWNRWLDESPHIFVLTFADDRLRDLTPEGGFWFDWTSLSGQFDVSPCGSEFAYAALQVNPDSGLLLSKIYRRPLKGGPAQALPGAWDEDQLRPRYSRDGRWLVYGRRADPYSLTAPVRLWRFDRRAETANAWLDKWHLSLSNWELDHHGAAYLTADEEGRAPLFVQREDGPPLPLLQEGTIVDVCPAADGQLYFTRQSLAEPGELFACRADGSGLRRLTHFSREALSPVALGETRELTFKGAADEPTHMFVVLPPDPVDGPLPLVQLIHGGPYGAHQDAFPLRSNAHLLAAAGFAVALVNYQGSVGWGQAFAESIEGAWNERPVDDVLLSCDALAEAGVATKDRMAIVGSSFGGYLALSISARSGKFRCCISHAGVFDLLGMYASDVTQGLARAQGGTPWDAIGAIDRQNAVRLIDRMTAPTLVTHGEMDFRVPVAQGLELYGLLKAKGVETRLVCFCDEGHWIERPCNLILWYDEAEAWLSRFLLAKDISPSEGLAARADLEGCNGQ
jgi:dipeptidyl aminopeptidase/acylaminoacyl peptidase